MALRGKNVKDDQLSDHCQWDGERRACGNVGEKSRSGKRGRETGFGELPRQYRREKEKTIAYKSEVRIVIPNRTPPMED